MITFAPLIAAMIASIGTIHHGSVRSIGADRDRAVPPSARSPIDSLVFEGRTPCDAIVTGFTGFPSQGCEKVKWRLTLRRDAAGTPTTYRSQGTRASHQGHWRIATGATGRTIYQLIPDREKAGLSLMSIEDRVLLVLGTDGRVLVGDASWSYVLNRIDLGTR